MNLFIKNRLNAVSTMSGISSIFIMMLFFLLCHPAGSTAMSQKASVHISHPVVGDVTGDVMVQGRGKSKWEPVERGTLLFSGDVIRSRSGGMASIRFASGKMELYEDTEIQIPSIGTQERKKDVRDVVVKSGRILMDISMAGRKSSFIFRTDNIQGQVNRSMFTVSYAGKGTAVNVYQGDVQVVQAGVYGKRTSSLVPGSSLRIEKGDMAGRVALFDPQSAVKNYRKKITPHLDKITGLPANVGIETKGSETDTVVAEIENTEQPAVSMKDSVVAVH